MYKKNIDFSSYTSIKIGSILSTHIVTEMTPQEHYKIIGKGYNLLIGPEAKHLAILSDDFTHLEITPDHLIKVGAGMSSRKLFKYAKEHNLKGFEFLSHLPGSIGGLIKMNAGMSIQGQRYEISDILVGIEYANGFVSANELDLTYRNSNVNDIIYYAFFKQEKDFRVDLLHTFKQIRSNQPKGPSFGSTFKNPPNHFAGQLIEAVKLKGFRHNGVSFSHQHANFLINIHNGTFEDAIFLINEAKRRVFLEFGIMLEEEVIIINH